MITIRNSHYQVDVDQCGSQLLKIINKNDNFNYLWDGSEWPKHAPLLFPAIGRSYNDSYLLNDKVYSMPQHGFAADQTFSIVEQADDSITLELLSNDETRKIYPFDFKLQVIYHLMSSGLSITFNLQNLSETKMPFSLGSHPAFNVPINKQGDFDDYYVDFFGNKDPLKVYKIIKKPYPFRTGDLEDIPTESNHQIKLSHQIFSSGLRIFANTDINRVTLSSPKSPHKISLMTTDFKNICLWTKEDQDLPFLCIEPFNGLPDIYGKEVDWFNKEGNLFIKPNGQKQIQYEIMLS